MMISGKTSYCGLTDNQGGEKSRKYCQLGSRGSATVDPRNWSINIPAPHETIKVAFSATCIDRQCGWPTLRTPEPSIEILQIASITGHSGELPPRQGW